MGVKSTPCYTLSQLRKGDHLLATIHHGCQLTGLAVQECNHIIVPSVLVDHHLVSHLLQTIHDHVDVCVGHVGFSLCVCV